MRLLGTAVGRWTSNNLIGLLALIVPVVLFLLTADLDRVATRIQDFWEWANPLARVLAAGVGLTLGAFLSYHAINLLTRIVRWHIRETRRLLKLCHHRLLDLFASATADILQDHEKRLTRVEQSLGMGDHTKLNLPDNMTPEMIEWAVRIYGRRRGVGDELVYSVPRMAQNSRDGYLVITEEHGTGGGSWHENRTAAESDFARSIGTAVVLVHVIESDWERRK